MPDCDGRVGMAAIILKEGVSVESTAWSTSFIQECEKNLAAYSRPAFLRVQTSLVVTATFKHQKANLVKDGFDPSNEDIVKSKDVLFHYSQRKKEVVALDTSLYQQIIQGKVKI